MGVNSSRGYINGYVAFTNLLVFDIVWWTIKVSRIDSLVVGVAYRSPNSNDQQNTSIEMTIKLSDCNFDISS